MEQLQETNSELTRLIQNSFLGEIETKSYTYREWQNESQALFRKEQNIWLEEMNKVNGKLADRQGRQAGFLADWEVGFSSNLGRDHVLSVEAKDLRLVLNDLENLRPRIEVSYIIIVQHHASRKDQIYLEGELYTTTNCTWVWPIHVAVSGVEPVHDTPNTIYSGFTGMIDSPFPGGLSQSGVGSLGDGDSLLGDNPSHFSTGYGSFTAVDRSSGSNAGMNG
jgi:hypothetical protein